MSALISRRNAIAKIAGGVALSASLAPLMAAETDAGTETRPKFRSPAQVKPAREELCRVALSLGLTSVDLQGPNDWAALKQFGLTCNLANGADLGRARGFSQVEHHEKLIANYRQIIPQVAQAGLTGLICYSGARGGLEAEAAIANSAAGIKPLLKLAEKNNVTLFMELSNNEINSTEYHVDFSAQYAELSKHIGSGHFKILQTVCQLQTVSRSAMAALRKYHPYLGCYYPAGLPNKAEFTRSSAAAGSEEMFQYTRVLQLVA